jgi:predicted Fe-Mo cluster-binding NifX family protein
MKIAIPITGSKLSPHFGHCEGFALFNVNPESKEIVSRNDVAAPPHQPGLLPRWLHEQGANVIVAGGMGVRARNLFAENNIEVVIGVQGWDPESIVYDLMQGCLQAGENPCDHSGECSGH